MEPPPCGIFTVRAALEGGFPRRKESGSVDFFTKISWGVVLILCLTIGLAPYSPPHIAEKLLLLFRGRLVKPVDWFDFALHGFPWVLLCGKAVSAVRRR